jgi:hypothetical protein
MPLDDLFNHIPPSGLEQADALRYSKESDCIKAIIRSIKHISCDAILRVSNTFLEMLHKHLGRTEDAIVF